MAKSVDFKQTKKDFKEINKGLKDQISYAEQLGDLKNKYNKANEREQDILSDVLDKTKDVMKNRKMLSDEQLNSVDLHKLERRLIAEGLDDQVKLVQKLKEENNIQKQINRTINAQAKVYGKIGSSVDNFVKMLPGGSLLGDLLGTGELGKEMSESFRTEVARGGGLGEFMKNMGGEAGGGFMVSLFKTSDVAKSKKAVRSFFAGGMSSAFGAVLAVAGATGLVRIAMQNGLESVGPINTVKRFFARGAFDGLREAFGNMGQSDRGTLFSMRMNKFRFGIDEKDQAKILAAQINISGASKDTALNIQKGIAKSASMRGVLPADVFQDLANATEQFATFAKDGGQNIGEAAIRARELGVSLDTVFKISDGILDFQSSIENELKASLLIGRQLNLNEARRLAMAGDMAGLQEEILRQVGSEEELQRMNAIQRKSLAGALGVTVSELNRLASGELEVKNSDMKQNTDAMKYLTSVLIGLSTFLGARLVGQGIGFGMTLVGRGGIGFANEKAIAEFQQGKRTIQSLRPFGIKGTEKELMKYTPRATRGLAMGTRVGLAITILSAIGVGISKLVGSSEETAKNTKRSITDQNFITSPLMSATPVKGNG
jgi:hypothetical protein